MVLNWKCFVVFLFYYGIGGFRVSGGGLIDLYGFLLLWCGWYYGVVVCCFYVDFVWDVYGWGGYDVGDFWK